MEVFRFDTDIAMTVAKGQTQSKLGQLIGNATLDQAGVLFLDEGSQYSPTASGLRQLFAITTGSCTVEADHLSPFILRTQQAVVAEPHERWSVSAKQSVVGLWMEGSFDIWAVAVTQSIVVVPYDEMWPIAFNHISKALWPHVDEVAIRIDHVGSTAVPGLGGKPVIDVDIVASRETQVAILIHRLELAGYRWRGDLGVGGREAFSFVGESDLPEHHLYVVVENNRAHLDHLLLRDLLREDRQARDEYAALKTSNMLAAEGNMDVYVAAKAAFVAQLLTRARAERGLPPVAYWIPE
ncbi:MAG TPA: GrpB family protein [Acidimicrobiales bacterium]|nr:GrpB family protein [Acidimicrobiales bacterium]